MLCSAMMPMGRFVYQLVCQSSTLVHPQIFQMSNLTCNDLVHHPPSNPSTATYKMSYVESPLRMLSKMLFRALLAVLVMTNAVPATSAISDEDSACTVISYFSFTKSRPGPFTGIYTDTTLPPTGYSLLAASELARQHFNARDSSVVPEMAELTRNCSVYIPEQRIVDGELSKDVTMKSILSELKLSFTPCAVIGAMESGVNDALKEVTNAIEVPHVLYWQVHQHLLDPRHSHNIISPIPSPRAVADIMLEYLGGHINREGMAIIHENPDLSADMVSFSTGNIIQNVCVCALSIIPRAMCVLT